MRLPAILALLPVILAGVFSPPIALHAEPVLAEVRVVSRLAYKSGESLTDYEKDRCHLSLHLPAKGHDLPALVWFHGGGLTQDQDDSFTTKIAERLARDGIAFVAAKYRLSPKATYPAYLEDVAAAFAWVKAHGAEHGIDPARVFVGGHSAGGYLAAMLGLDARWLQPHGLKPDAIAGLIPISGQVMTHFTVRAERGITDRNVITADEAAPINHLRKDTPPFLIIFADKDWPARREENLYFAAALRATGNTRVRHLQVDDRNHVTIASNIAQPGDPAAEAIIRFVTRSEPAVR